MGIIEYSLFLYATYKRKKFIKRVSQADTEQRRLFRRFMQKTQGSLFAQTYTLDTYTSYEDFQKKVPVTTYENFFPYIEKILQKEKNIIFNDTVSSFAKSSGTTNARSKYIPLSDAHLGGNHYKAGKDMLFSSIAMYKNPSFVYNTMIGTSGSFSVDTLYPDARIGDVSTHLVSKLPWYARLSHPAPVDVLTDPVWNTKIKSMVLHAKTKNVQSFFGTPTWMLHILDEALHQTSKKNAIDIWPELSVFFHGAVFFEPYKKAFEERVGKPLHYMNIYNASEGYFGFQYNTEKSDEFVLLTHHDIFYECLPLDQLDTAYPQALPLSEIILGIEYALVITTGGGLMRYIIGDTVRFTAKNPYLFQLTGRTKQRLNVFGEEVSIENLETALFETAEKYKNQIVHFTTTTHLTSQGTGHHVWCIEYENPCADIGAFAETLDTSLKHYNSDYDAKRTGDYIISKPEIIVVKKGTFYQWLVERNKLGGQHKIPRITDTRNMINELQVISASL